MLADSGDHTSLSPGLSSLIQSRAFSVNQQPAGSADRRRRRRCCGPRAPRLALPVSGSTRRICETLYWRNADVEGRPERDAEPAVLVGVRDTSSHAPRRTACRHTPPCRHQASSRLASAFSYWISLLTADHVRRAITAIGEAAGRHVEALEDGLDALSCRPAVGRWHRRCRGRTSRRTACRCRPKPSGAKWSARPDVDFDLEAGRQLDFFHQRGEFGFRWSRSAVLTAAPGPFCAPRFHRRGTSYRADGSRIPCCRTGSSRAVLLCTILASTPATMRMAAHATTD